MIEILPTLLFSLFIVAFIFMMAATYCAFAVFQIARKSFLLIYELDEELYKSILNGKEISWIERKTYSVKDFSLWWRLYSTLYNRADIAEVVGNKVRSRFIIYARIMLASYVMAIILVVIVLVVGFMLAAGN